MSDNRSEIGTLGGEMNEESVKYALIGLRKHLKSNKIKQHVFAEGVTTPEHFSKILNFKAGASAEMIRRLAQKAGMEPTDLVLLGKKDEEKSDRGTPPQPPPSNTFPGIEANYIDPTLAISAVTVLVNQYLTADDRLHCWLSVFDQWPTAALLIKDGIVVRQNTRSMIWGSVTGKVLCDACVGRNECEKETCPVTIATETREHASGYRIARDHRYKVDVSPMRYKDSDYLIVSATEAPHEGHDEGERRHGVEDRRE